MDTKNIILSGTHVPEITKRAVESLKNRKAERLKLLTKIRNLYFVNRMHLQEIALAVGVSAQTVRKYLERIRRDYGEIARVDIDLTKDLHQFYWELQERYNERVKRLWVEYHAAANGKLRMALLKEVREQERQHISVLQELGIVHKESAKIDLKAVALPAELKEKTDEDLRKELADVLGVATDDVPAPEGALNAVSSGGNTGVEDGGGVVASGEPESLISESPSVSGSPGGSGGSTQEEGSSLRQP